MKFKLPLLLLLLAVLCYACEDDKDNVIDKLPGNWFCEESSSQYGAASYTVEISRSTINDNEIIIDNFYHLGSGNKVSAIVEHSDLEIPEQTVMGFTFSGRGTVSDEGSKISISYTADDNGGVDNVSAVFTRH